MIFRGVEIKNLLHVYSRVMATYIRNLSEITAINSWYRWNVGLILVIYKDVQLILRSHFQSNFHLFYPWEISQLILYKHNIHTERGCRMSHRTWNNGPNCLHWLVQPFSPFPVQHSASPHSTIKLFSTLLSIPTGAMSGGSKAMQLPKYWPFSLTITWVLEPSVFRKASAPQIFIGMSDLKLTQH